MVAKDIDPSSLEAAIAEPQAMVAVLEALKPLTPDGQSRVLDWVSTRLGLKVAPPSVVTSRKTAAAPHSFVDAFTPKEFLADKRPSSYVERVVCLGYYLQHVAGLPEGFKTKDITNLNQQAAQPKFSNPSQAVKDAVRAQLLAPAGPRGLQQLTPRGEAIVMALPDPEAVKQAKATFPVSGRPARRRITEALDQMPT